MTIATAEKHLQDLNDLGIESVEKFSLHYDEYRMVKGNCESPPEVMLKIINEGIKLEGMRYKTEEYIKPLRPLQCFKCQKFNHLALDCPSDESFCVKCGGKHKVSECSSLEKK
jgi:hypothetical protein